MKKNLVKELQRFAKNLANIETNNNNAVGVLYELNDALENASVEIVPWATPTVQDGSLTEPKFSEALALKTVKDYVTPQMFGATGDGETDDYGAISDCIAYSKETGIPIKIISDHYLEQGLTLNGVNISGDTKHILKFKSHINPLVTIDGSCNLKNIRFDYPDYSYDQTERVVGLLVKASSCRFDNVEVRNCFCGIQMGYPALNVAYNFFNRCYVRNCAEGIYIIATGTNGYTNEHVFNECTVRIDSNIKTRLANLGLDDRYAITLERDTSTSKNINSIRFIACNVENCFNGFSVRAYYCLFANCRTDGNNIYYYFHQTNGGYNTVIGAEGTATDGGIQRVFEKLDNDDDNKNNFIQMRNYPLYTEILRFGSRVSSNRPVLSTMDRGTCIYDITINLPIWWTGSKWIDAAGNDV